MSRGLGCRCLLDTGARRAAPDRLARRLATPAPEGMGFFACMLGGEDGRTLLLCSAPDFVEHNRADTREAVLFTTTVEVPHAGLP